MRLPRPEDLHTIEQAAQALDVPAARIRAWKNRGLVMPADYLPERVRGDGRRPLFYLEELRPRVSAYRSRVARVTGPSIVDGELVARCACGETRQVPLTTVTNGKPCAACGASTADGLMKGPDRVAIMKMFSRASETVDDTNNVVYFVRTAQLVKIGTTWDVWRRIAELGHPELLGVLPGGYRVEREHHARFDDEHVTGEVFQASDRLLAYVAEHCTLPTRPTKIPWTPTTEIPRWAWDS